MQVHEVSPSVACEVLVLLQALRNLLLPVVLGPRCLARHCHTCELRGIAQHKEVCLLRIHGPLRVAPEGRQQEELCEVLPLVDTQTLVHVLEAFNGHVLPQALCLAHACLCRPHVVNPLIIQEELGSAEVQVLHGQASLPTDGRPWPALPPTVSLQLDKGPWVLVALRCCRYCCHRGGYCRAGHGGGGDRGGGLRLDGGGEGGLGCVCGGGCSVGFVLAVAEDG
mmetsp:Transcript_12043/g.29451  ORF Transcript_12043/g.29451 Transcript_12043/m.29451 type:complete len:224 (-) Transcript_12043:208-879(-)